MKQSEKSKNTYNRILSSAIEEFSEKGYNNASLNIICSKYKISKGLIYHNFKNKDELYLCVIKECFDKLVNYLKQADYSSDDDWENMKKLLMLRQEFFEKNENYRNIFFSVILTPPNHLIKEIQMIRKEYDEFNIGEFKKLLRTLNLREEITEEMAISYFLTYQEMFNAYFQNKIYKSRNLSLVSKEHDLKLLPILDVMIYGIASKEKGNDKNKQRKKDKDD